MTKEDWTDKAGDIIEAHPVGRPAPIMDPRRKPAMSDEELNSAWHYATGWNAAIRACAAIAESYDDMMMMEQILELDRSVKAIDD